MSITTNQFNAIVDNIAKSIVDLQTSFVPGTVNSAQVTTSNNGQTAGSNSLYARITALSAGDQLGKLGTVWQKVGSNVAGYLAPANSSVYPLFYDAMLALEKDLGGVYDFMWANSLVAHQEFVACFNDWATKAEALHAIPNQPTLLPLSFAFPTTEVSLGTFISSGAATGAFTAGTALDLTKVGCQPLFLKNTAGAPTTGTATVVTVTFTNAAGNAAATAPVTLGGALAAGAYLAIPSATGSTVANITQASGATGDHFAVVARVTRAVAY